MSRRHLINSSDVFVIKGFTVPKFVSRWLWIFRSCIKTSFIRKQFLNVFNFITSFLETNQIDEQLHLKLVCIGCCQKVNIFTKSVKIDSSSKTYTAATYCFLEFILLNIIFVLIVHKDGLNPLKYFLNFKNWKSYF